MPEENQETKIVQDVESDVVSNAQSNIDLANKDLAKPDLASPDPVVSLRTLRNDLQDVVREQKMSLARVVALQQDRTRVAAATIDPQEQAQRARRKQFLMSMVFFIVVLFGLGGASLFGVFIVMQSRVGTSQSTLPNTSLIFAEHSVGLVLTGRSPQDIKNILAASRNGNTGTLGSITRIVPLVETAGTSQQREATTQEFLSSVGGHVSDDLLRALDSSFFLGIHIVDKNAPVLVIPVLSYDRAFAGMLSWEANLNGDLQPFFTALPPLTTDAHGLPIQRPFQDAVVRNYDVRELKDDSGNVQMYYSFPTPRVLIIAESLSSFPEVLSRLQASRRL